MNIGKKGQHHWMLDKICVHKWTQIPEKYAIFVQYKCTRKGCDRKVDCALEMPALLLKLLSKKDCNGK